MKLCQLTTTITHSQKKEKLKMIEYRLILVSFLTRVRVTHSLHMPLFVDQSNTKQTGLGESNAGSLAVSVLHTKFNTGRF